MSISEAQIGDQAFLIGVARDITDRKRLEELLRHIPTHDALTNLPTRSLLLDRLDQTIKLAGRKGGSVAVLFVDLDNFKAVIDTLGHSVGDRLLRTIADTLTKVLRKTDTVARLGGDEFVLVARVASSETATRLAEKILGIFASPFHLGGNDVLMSASVGISMSPEGETDAAALIKNADTAMSAAKSAGKAAYRFYMAEMNQAVSERRSLVAAPRHAIARNELFHLYEPRIDLRSGRVAGVEALLR